MTGCVFESDNTVATGDPVAQTATTNAFPSGIAVASPLDLETPGAAPAMVQAAFTSQSQMRNSNRLQNAYRRAVDRINEVLDGTMPVRDVFTPTLFFTQDRDAPCYGPQLLYENHPDALTPNSGTLPTGDLGLWNETEITGTACAAAQLNARLRGVRDRSYIALMSVASMVSVFIDADNTWPDDVTAGTAVALTAEMNALGISDTTFTSATMALDAAGQVWTYTIELIYSGSGTPYDISLTLIHVPGSSDDYEGLLTYTAESTLNPPGNCPTTDVTLNGSLHYVKHSANDIRMQSRGVQTCGHGSTALTKPLTDIYPTTAMSTGSVVDPDPGLWGNNFNRFTANFDPDDLGGHYSMVWQAGPMDSHSRILNVGLEAETAGESYFGFGDPVDTPTDGSIQGFICNWAGPGNDHTLQDYAQRQHITLNTVTNQYEPSNSAASDITYAPTNSCTYDGSGSYLYDRDLDDDLTDETAATVNVAPGEVLELDLMAPSGSATTIWDHIVNNRGYDLPLYP
jgi:hypothetical protein